MPSLDSTQDSQLRQDNNDYVTPNAKRHHQLHQTAPEPTLISFAPFVTPRRDVSVDTTTSATRTAKVRAPNDARPPSATETTSTTDSSPSDQKSERATRDILDEIIAPSRDVDPLFVDRDVDYYRQHPVALERADLSTLQRLTKRYSLPLLLKTLGRDMAQKDAELTDMRRRLEEMASLFKDHLCTIHNLSRVEADKTLHNMTTQLYNRENLHSSLESALNSPIETIMTGTPKPRLNTPKLEATPAAATAPDVPMASCHSKNEPIRPLKHSKSMWTMFGGRATPKANKHDPKNRSRTNSTTPHFTRVLAERDRGSSIGSASVVTSISGAGPVELNAIVDSEELPPLLMSAGDLKAQYSDYTADVYGFIIDSVRVDNFVDKDNDKKTQHSSRDPQTLAVDTPVGSIKNADTRPAADTDQDTTAWTSYLNIDGSSLSSLSWLPIASPKPLDSSPATIEAMNDHHSEPTRLDATERLQRQIMTDHSKLEKERTIPWERFLTFEAQTREQPTAFMSALLMRQTPAARTNRTFSDAQQPNGLTKDARLERTKLVLGGIPMHLRARIWSHYINEYMMHEPDEYSQLVKQSKSIDTGVVAEIEDDMPRTLTNNVFFRCGKGRSSLDELLRAYIVKKPEIGYCQGMNLIGGYLLLALPSTETAFWIFCYMIEHVLAETYFDATLRGASIEITVLRSYIRDLIPALAAHMEDLDVADPETVPYNWFLTAFASTLSIEALYRVWDVVLGLPTQKNFLLRVAIALLKANEEKLRTFDNPFELRDYMDRRICGPDVSIDGLIKASSKLGSVIKDEEVRKRRRHFAFKIDEPGR